MEEIVVNALIQALFFLLPAWRIYKKAGLQPTLSLTVVIPIFGVIICSIILLASKWNVQTAEEK